MKYWDSSAIVPLVSPEAQSVLCHGVAKRDPRILVWALTPIEVLSALVRKQREGTVDAAGFAKSKRALAELEVDWDVVESLAAVCDRARRLLEVHTLRAADALQLAAALILCAERTAGFEYVVLDGRLREAAAREGFTVLP